MKKLLILPFCFLLINCSFREKPLFVKVDNMQVISSDWNHVKLTADAYFINQNDVGGSLKSENIDVIINEVVVAKMSSQEFEVPSRKEFTIPLQVDIPTKEIFEKNPQGVLSGILNSLLQKKVNVQYKGIITYQKLGVSYDYEVDTTQEITIKM